MGNGKVARDTFGIFQGDIIIRTAIMEGLRELRLHPYLLDWAFVNLLQDQLTIKEYGEQEIFQAKEWFRKTDIPVVPNTRYGEPHIPCVSVGQMQSNEDSATLADLHYDPEQEIDAEWAPLTSRLSLESYDGATGRVEFSDDFDLLVCPGMNIVAKDGSAHLILETQDDGGIFVESGTQADFDQAEIKGAKPVQIASVESVVFGETYQVGCHVSGEPVYLSYLHSIVTFVLLRGREELLEGRGFERSQLRASPVQDNPMFADAKEPVFERYITLNGFVRNSWPKKITSPVEGVGVDKFVIIDSDTLPDPMDPNSHIWVGDRDVLGDY